VLRKNSNDSTVQGRRGDVFFAKSCSTATHFSCDAHRTGLLILKWAEKSSWHRIVKEGVIIRHTADRK
jgi:hypothetical protein